MGGQAPHYLLGRFLDMPSLGRFVGVPVNLANGSNAASDVLVCFVRQIRQGHAQRPVGGLEATTVEQHDPVILGQSECEIERVNMLLQVVDRFVALSVLRAQNSKSIRP